jgi:hypothetical protein
LNPANGRINRPRQLDPDDLIGKSEVYSRIKSEGMPFRIMLYSRRIIRSLRLVDDPPANHSDAGANILDLAEWHGQQIAVK